MGLVSFSAALKHLRLNSRCPCVDPVRRFPDSEPEMPNYLHGRELPLFVGVQEKGRRQVGDRVCLTREHIRIYLHAFAYIEALSLVGMLDTPLGTTPMYFSSTIIDLRSLFVEDFSFSIEQERILNFED